MLAGVDFELLEGEVHALMGENGAGKSTLMNILTGIHTRDDGVILIDGKEVSFTHPREAEDNGIVFIHQELNIWPEMTVLENLFVGKEETNGWGFLNQKKMKALAEEQMSKLSLSLPLDQAAVKCSVGQQQMIEICKALMTKAKVMIMDEPTLRSRKKKPGNYSRSSERSNGKVCLSSTYRTGWKKFLKLATALR